MPENLKKMKNIPREKLAANMTDIA